MTAEVEGRNRYLVVDLIEEAFPRSVLQEVTFRGDTTYLIQENYIVCIFLGEE